MPFGNVSIVVLFTQRKLIYHLTIGKKNTIVQILQLLYDFGKVFSA